MEIDSRKIMKGLNDISKATDLLDAIKTIMEELTEGGFKKCLDNPKNFKPDDNAKFRLAVEGACQEIDKASYIIYTAVLEIEEYLENLKNA